MFLLNDSVGRFDLISIFDLPQGRGQPIRFFLYFMASGPRVCVLRMAPREARHKSIGRAGTGKDNNSPGCVMPSKEDWCEQPNLAALSC